MSNLSANSHALNHLFMFTLRQKSFILLFFGFFNYVFTSITFSEVKAYRWRVMMLECMSMLQWVGRSVTSVTVLVCNRVTGEIVVIPGSRLVDWTHLSMYLLPAQVSRPFGCKIALTLKWVNANPAVALLLVMSAILDSIWWILQILRTQFESGYVCKLVKNN